MYKLKHFAVAVGPLCSIKGGNNSLATLHKKFYIDLPLTKRKKLGHVWALQMKLTSTAKECINCMLQILYILYRE